MTDDILQRLLGLMFVRNIDLFQVFAEFSIGTHRDSLFLRAVRSNVAMRQSVVFQ